MKHVQKENEKVTTLELEQKIRKRSRGITLIALVITVIVLLILAGISIAMLTGENGILTQAQNSKEEMRGASVQEEIDLWELNKISDEAAGTSTAMTRAELLDDLKVQGLISEEEYATLNDGETITIGKRQITLGSDAKTLVQAFLDGEIEIGNYVNYTPIGGKNTSVTESETGYNATQNYTVDMDTTWRVLGLSEDGENLLLTSGSPIKKDGEDPYLILQGAESYYECVDTLDKICNIYKNDYADEVRSMTADDINRVLGLTVDKTANKLYKTSDTEKTTELPFQGFFGQTYEYVAGDYAIENYMKEKYPTNTKYQALTSKGVGDEVPGTAYAYPITESSIVEQGGTIYNMLFADTLETDNYAKSYWLASPGAYAHPGDRADFGPGRVAIGCVLSGYDLFHSTGRWFAYGLGVRPVVSLNSKITVDDIQVIADKTEEVWTTTTGEAVASGNLESEGITTGQITE